MRARRAALGFEVARLGYDFYFRLHFSNVISANAVP
jgi:hypothetical protein